MVLGIDTTTTNYANASPIPGLILIAIGLIIWAVIRFARNNKILVRAAFGLLFLYLLALIAPNMIIWFRQRLADAQAAATGSLPSREAPRAPRHAAEPSSEPARPSEGIDDLFRDWLK